MPTTVLSARPNVLGINGRPYGIVDFHQAVDCNQHPGWQQSPEGPCQAFVPMTDPVWN